MPKYIISVTAADRVGIVYSVTGALLDLGGNILELSQTVMRGYFTIIVETEFPAPLATKQLAETILERGKRFDLQVLVSEARNGTVEPAVAGGEDAALARAVEAGDLTLSKLEAMTAVCSVGLDMIAVPGDTDAETLAALIADEVAIGVVNHKTTAVRVIPVPGKGPGDRAVFGGLFGETAILSVHAAGGASAFVRHGGRIPAPLSSLRN